MVFLLGDFNTQVGRNRDRWYPILDKFDVGKENSNGYRLLQFCRYNNLVITNTLFAHKMAHKLTWYSRDGKTSDLIDYVIVNRRLVGSIQDTWVYRSAVIDVKSKDHRQIVFKANLKLKFRKGKYLLGSYDGGRLQDVYKNYLSNRYYENKRNVKKVEKALKYELGRREVEAKDKMPKIWKMQLDGIIMKYCRGILINLE